MRERDDLTIEQITLLNELGRHEEALDILLQRHFHPWEGGEGKVSAQYILSLTELGRRAMPKRSSNCDRTAQTIAPLARFVRRRKAAGIQENNIHYWLGQANRKLGRKTEARDWFERASLGLAEPSSVQYYNDQPPEMIFYQGLACRALGREAEACSRFNILVDYARESVR